MNSKPQLPKEAATQRKKKPVKTHLLVSLY